VSRLIIAGGGIAGLATAVAVSLSGREVIVLERRPEFTELGAGIQLAPNAFRALDQLGVGSEVRICAVRIDELRLMDGAGGQPIARLPLGLEFRHRYGNPYAVVHRNDLYAPLLETCRRLPLVELITNAPVERYHRHARQVGVELASGETFWADALIGADGLHSAVRAQLVGDGAPRVSGHTIFRSVIPIERVPAGLRWNAATLWAADKRHVVHYPIEGGRSFNLAATVDDGATTVASGEPVDRGQVLDTFAGLCQVPRQLLELGQDWRRWVLCDRDPVSRWTDGQVVLLGDAAHPMLQYAAQGACLALEDAVDLGSRLEHSDDLPKVFAEFNAARAERTSAMQIISRRMGDEVYHPAGDDAARRTALLSSLSTEDMYRKLDWLYSTGTREYAHAH
jgi:3-hydroxybenzoate 6-monooxygenase